MLEPLVSRQRQVWNNALVAGRCKSACDVLRRQPPVQAKGYFGVWPHFKPEFSDLVGRKLEPMKRPLPSPREITYMEETMWWTVGLEEIDGNIVWLKARRYIWKEIAPVVGLSPAVTMDNWNYANWVIAQRLNGRPFVKLPSKRYVLDVLQKEREKKRRSNEKKEKVVQRWHYPHQRLRRSIPHDEQERDSCSS
jgi:hypothetical protein